jgi:hypothetical protein
VPFSTPYPSCIWCGARANSHEHAIPAWMSKQLGIKAMMGGWTIGLPPSRHLISFASYRHRIFCKPCNAHFGKLEEAVIPLLVPMAKGRTLVLDADSQALLALWAAKTAMALLASKSELRELVPQDHRDSVRYASKPPAECWVGYFPWHGREVFTGGEGTIDDNREPPSRYRTYGEVFVFGTVGFKVMGIIDPPPDPYVLALDEPYICQFWPPTPGMIIWPPEVAPITEGDLLGLALLLPVMRRS